MDYRATKHLAAAFAASVMMFASPASALELGWSGGPMSASGDTIRTDGELVWAVAGGHNSGSSLGEITVNGVPFTTVNSLSDYPSSYTLPFSVNPGIPYDASGLGDHDVTGDYAQMLEKGFWNSAIGGYTFTLNGLETGSTYLVQVVCHRDTTGYTVVAPDGVATISTGKGDWTYGGSLVGVFVAQDSSYTFKLNYASSDGGSKAHFNAFQVRKIPAVGPVIIEPQIGSLKIKSKGSTATVSLADVRLGTSATGETDATEYAVSYSLDGGDVVTVLECQTSETAEFDIPDLTDGAHSISVVITTDEGLTSDDKSMTFKISTQGLDAGWTGEPMSESGDTVHTEGELVYSYARKQGNGTYEVNGVEFKALSDGGDFKQASKNPDVSISPDGFDWATGLGNEGVDGDYGRILDNAFTGWQLSGNVTYTLKNLVAGESYLVQVILHRSGQTYAVTLQDSDAAITVGGDGWKYGGSLVGVFIADGPTCSFTLNYGGAFIMNAIQVRKIDAIVPKKSDPSIGSVTAMSIGATATIELTGVKMGTDDDAVPATSYSVFYSLNGGAEVEALTKQTTSAAQFVLSTLRDGDYTCAVWIATDKAKTTDPKAVDFKVNTKVGDFSKIKASIEEAQMGETVVVPPGLYLATSKINVSKKNVTIVAMGNVVINGEYSTEGVFNIAAEGVTVSGIEFEKCNNADYGGAINVNNNYHGFVATNCIFRNCGAKMGGAIGGSCYYGQYGAESSDGIPARGELGVISGCTFIDCASTGTSAGDGASSGGSVSGAYWIENSTFEGGTSFYYSPGIHSGFNLMVTNCTFTKIASANSSTRGAIYMSRGNTELQVIDCTFVDMTCQPLFGAASNKMLVDRCVIENCTGAETKPDDQGIGQLAYGSGTIRDSLICKNVNPLLLGNQVFENCTIVDNIGGFCIKIFSNAAPSFKNCVWARNTKWEGGGYTAKGGAGLCWHGSDPDAYTKATFDHCALEGASLDSNLMVLFGQDATGTTKTLSEALDRKGPRFTDPENGDYTLLLGSPLKDAGLFCDWMTGAKDLAGNPRDKDGKVDLGCYERMKKGLIISIQ